MSKLRPSEVRCLVQDHMSEGTGIPVFGRSADCTYALPAIPGPWPGLSGQVSEGCEEASWFIIHGAPALSNQQVGGGRGDWDAHEALHWEK